MSGETSPADGFVAGRSSPAERRLVIHADDFGMSHSVNRATGEAIENGWVTSSSIMVTCPWFPEAADFARRHPAADFGVHLTLNSEWTSFRWGPVSPRAAVPSLLDRDGYFPLVETDVIERARIADVEAELRAQIEMAKDAGIAMSHLDSHMLTLFGSPALFESYLELGRRYGVPLRVGTPPSFAEPNSEPSFELLDAICEVGPDLAADRWLEGYQEMLGPLPAGTFQMTVHLGYDDDEMRGATAGHPNWGAAWRQRDLDLVRSDAFRKFIEAEGFALVSWRDLAR
jgi:predicted glycoside hydrolase/deacetylase ChbG (UPF0249 family)